MATDVLNSNTEDIVNDVVSLFRKIVIQEIIMKGNLDSFVEDALYAQFRDVISKEIENTFLTQGKFEIGNIGYLTSAVKKQGTQSGKVINNVKLQFIPTKEFRERVNSTILNPLKQGEIKETTKVINKTMLIPAEQYEAKN